jgi:hypothetical protein
MSVPATDWVWKHSRAVGNARLVLLAIADRAEPNGTGAFPTVETLAKRTRLSPRTVQRCIHSLEAAGELSVERDVGRVNRYAVRMTSSTGSPVSASRGADASQSRMSQRQLDTPVNVTPVSAVTPPPTSLLAHSQSSTSNSSPAPGVWKGPGGVLASGEPTTHSRQALPRRLDSTPGANGTIRFSNPFDRPLPVPRKAHDRFLDVLGGRVADVEAALRSFYAETKYAWTAGDRRNDVADSDMFKFWNARFSETWPPTPPRAAPPRPADRGDIRAVPTADTTAERYKILTGREAYRAS